MKNFEKSTFDLERLIEDFRLLVISDDCSCRCCSLANACEEDEDDPICLMDSDTFRDHIEKLYKKGETT